MKKIAIFQEDLSVGGIQKSLINLLNALDYTKYAVDLFLLREENFYKAELPERVNVIYCRGGGRLGRLAPYGLQRLFRRKAYREFGPYEIAIDFNSYQIGCALGATCVRAKRCVSWIHNDVGIKYAQEWRYRVLWALFRGKFKYFDGFVAVSPGLAAPFRALARVGDKPIDVINNYIDTDEIFSRMQEKVDDLTVDPACFNLIAVGKLCHQKAYDVMMQVIADVVKVRPEVRLYILGDGPDRGALLRQRAQMQLENCVFFLGKRANPFPYLSMMDAFLSTSRYEGQPLNIMEAKAVGLPIFMTKNLEKYCAGLTGCADIRAALIHAQRQPKLPDTLSAYNQEITRRLEALLDGAAQNETE